MKKFITYLLLIFLLAGCASVNNKEPVVEKTDELSEEEKLNNELIEKYGDKLLYFEDEEVIWGADPGLGIDVLKKLGYTGKGAIIAYADGVVDPKGNEQFKDADIIYHRFPNNNSTNGNEWHGNGVLSLILGKDIGTAPDVKLHYYGYLPESGNYQPIADVIREVIRFNETLPDDKKISMLGFSNNVYGIDEAHSINYQDARLAAKECREAGIMIFFCGENNACYYKHGSNRNDPENCYKIPIWENFPNELSYVPAATRTVGMPENTYMYDDENNPGMSWTMPYTIGVYAIAKSIDKDLTEADIRKLNLSTATINSRGMSIFNPCEFIATVLERVERNEEAKVLREEYAKTLVNYDENKYKKMQLDKSLKPVVLTLVNANVEYKTIAKRIKPNAEILKDKREYLKNVYCGDNNSYKSYPMNFSSRYTNDSTIKYELKIRLPKGLKCTVYDYPDKNVINEEIGKTNGNNKVFTAEINIDDAKNIDTLVYEFDGLFKNKYCVYVDLFSINNPNFIEVLEDIDFPTNDYDYHPKTLNEIDYSYSAGDSSNSVVKFDEVTFTKNDNDDFEISFNVITSNKMRVFAFDPPNGDILFEELGTTEPFIELPVSFKVNRETLEKINDITILVAVSDDDRAFIFFDTKQLLDR